MDGRIATDGGPLDDDADVDADAEIPPRPDGGGDCTDGLRNGGETDVDCGRVCPSPDQCSEGENCEGGADCRSGVCTAGACAAPACDDRVMNGLERDVDCGGGTCPGCAPGERCLLGSDCESGVCAPDATCAAPTCEDGVANQDEVGVDCAGPCPPCRWFQPCRTGADCASGTCEMESGSLRCVEYPSIDSLTPNRGHVNDPISVIGSGFHSPMLTFRFGTTTTTGTRVSETEAVVTAPDRPLGTVDVAVANTDGRESDTRPFTYIGEATFASPVAVVVDATWATVDRVRTGDIDGDGDPDVLVADGTGWTAGLPSIRVLRNAAGVLSTGSTIAFAANVSDFRLARLDAGTALDVVASLSNGSVAVALGNGDGTFDPPVETALGGTGAGEIWTGHVDVDARVDAVVVYNAPSIERVGILSGLGDGRFGPVQSVTLPGRGFGLTAFQLRDDPTLEIFVGQSSDVRRVTFAGTGWVSLPADRYIFGDGLTLDDVDLEGDGDVDLVHARGVLTSDSGTFLGLSVSFTDPGERARDLVAAHLDGDGRPDIAYVVGASYVQLRIGIPGPAFRYAATTLLTPQPTYAIDAADIDGDGLLDLVVGGSTSLYVFSNETP